MELRPAVPTRSRGSRSTENSRAAAAAPLVVLTSREGVFGDQFGEVTGPDRPRGASPYLAVSRFVQVQYVYWLPRPSSLIPPRSYCSTASATVAGGAIATTRAGAAPMR